MNTIEFVENVPAEKLALIFKDFYEQHMFVYDLLKGIQFISLNKVDVSTASIIYSVKVLDDTDKALLLKHLNSKAGINIYNKKYKPEIYLNDNLICISIKK